MRNIKICLLWLYLIYNFEVSVHFNTDVELDDKHVTQQQSNNILVSFRLPMKVSLCVAVIIFIGTNIASAVSARKYQDQSTALPLYLLYIRVAINDTLFVIMGLLLSVCIFRIVKISAASVVLEAKVEYFNRDVLCGNMIYW